MIGKNLSEEEKQLLINVFQEYIDKNITVNEAVETLSPTIDKLMLEHWQDDILPNFATIEKFGDNIYIIPIPKKDKPIKVYFES